MSVSKSVLAISAALIVIAGVLYIGFSKKAENRRDKISQEVKIQQTWKLPNVLEEVSGIAFLEDQRLAAVQDEDGFIFIYDLETSNIVEKIKFAGGGDYEGIAIAGNTAFVLRSDGTIFKVEDFQSNPTVTEHQLPLDKDMDMEGMFYDPSKHRLLIAHKEEDPETNVYKGIYAVDPGRMELQEEPVYKIMFENDIFEATEEDLFDRMKPSEIAVHPKTGEIYILEGQIPKLLILDAQGKPKELHFLDVDDFHQPEGIAFDAEGKIFISNEGNPATIHQISL